MIEKDDLTQRFKENPQQQIQNLLEEALKKIQWACEVAVFHELDITQTGLHTALSDSAHYCQEALNRLNDAPDQ